MLALVAYIIGALCFIAAVVLLSFIPKTTIKFLAMSVFSLFAVVSVTVMLINISGQPNINSFFTALSSPQSAQKSTLVGAQTTNISDSAVAVQNVRPKASLGGIVNDEGAVFVPKDDGEGILNDFLSAWQQYDGDAMLQYTDGFARDNLEKELPFNRTSPIEWCEVRWVDEKGIDAKSAYVNITAVNKDRQPVDIRMSINLGYKNDRWYITDIRPDEPKEHIFEVSEWLEVPTQNIMYTSDLDLTYLLEGLWEDYKLINPDGSEDNIFGTTYMFYPDGTFIDEYDGIVSYGYWWVESGMLHFIYEPYDTIYSWPIGIEYDVDSGIYLLYISLEGPNDDEIFVMIRTSEMLPPKPMPEEQNEIYTDDVDLEYFLDGVWQDYKIIYADGSEDMIGGTQWTFYLDGSFEELANNVVNSGKWQVNSSVLSMAFDSHDIDYAWPIYIEYNPNTNEYLLYLELAGAYAGDTTVMIKSAQSSPPPATPEPTQSPDPTPSPTPTTEQPVNSISTNDILGYWEGQGVLESLDSVEAFGKWCGCNSSADIDYFNGLIGNEVDWAFDIDEPNTGDVNIFGYMNTGDFRFTSLSASDTRVNNGVVIADQSPYANQSCIINATLSYDSDGALMMEGSAECMIHDTNNNTEIRFVVSFKIKQVHSLN